MEIMFSSRRILWCGLAIGGLVGREPDVREDFPALALVAYGDSVNFATITTDTGALAPGNRDFSRFSTPGACLGAVDLATEVLRHSVAAQIDHLLQDTAFRGDTLPAGAVQIARTCAARFTVAGTAEHNLPELFALSLAAGNDSTARSVVARQLEHITKPVARAAVLQRAIDGYLAAAPTRIAAAESTLAQLDALGPSVMKARFHAHGTLLQYSWSRFNEASMRREAEQMIALGHDVPTDAIRYDYEPLVWAYRTLGVLAYVNTPDSVLAVMTRAKADLRRFPPGRQWPAGMSYGSDANYDYKVHTPAEIRDRLLPFQGEQYKGRLLPPISAAYWFPKPPKRWPPGSSADNTRLPSLIVYGGFADDCARIGLGSWLDGGISCRAKFEHVLRYGDRLAVTFIAHGWGYAARTALLKPPAEADTIAWFLRDYHQLPFTVGVVTDSIRILPPVDGRWLRSDTTFYGTHYTRNEDLKEGNVLLLYDADGTLLYVGRPDDIDHSPLLRRLIERAVGRISAASLH